jgi:hypothetical protein
VNMTGEESHITFQKHFPHICVTAATNPHTPCFWLLVHRNNLYWTLEIPYFSMHITINIFKSSVGRLLSLKLSHTESFLAAFHHQPTNLLPHYEHTEYHVFALYIIW